MCNYHKSILLWLIPVGAGTPHCLFTQPQAWRGEGENWKGESMETHGLTKSFTTSHRQAEIYQLRGKQSYITHNGKLERYNYITLNSLPSSPWLLFLMSYGLEPLLNQLGSAVLAVPSQLPVQPQPPHWYGEEQMFSNN